MRVLREICTRSHYGWHPADLARRCELKESTARRILAGLLDERMVSRRPHDGRYLPGPMIFELSTALPAYAAFQRAGQERLVALAKSTRGIASLYLRSGDDFVCVAQVAGSSTKGKASMQVGSRHPLLLSTGGLAILAALKRKEARPVIARNLAYLEQIGEVRIKAVKRAVQRSQAAGLGLNEGLLVPGFNAYGFAIRDASGDVFGAIVLAGASIKFPPTRLPEFRVLLERESVALSSLAADLFSPKSSAE